MEIYPIGTSNLWNCHTNQKYIHKSQIKLWSVSSGFMEINCLIVKFSSLLFNVTCLFYTAQHYYYYYWSQFSLVMYKQISRNCKSSIFLFLFIIPPSSFRVFSFVLLLHLNRAFKYLKNKNFRVSWIFIVNGDNSFQEFDTTGYVY